MTKDELVRSVSREVDMNQGLISKAIDSVFSNLKESLGKGDSFRMVGFGSFRVVERAERRGRNPKTGEEIVIPARKTVRFAPGKDLKELMNPKAEAAVATTASSPARKGGKKRQ